MKPYDQALALHAKGFQVLPGRPGKKFPCLDTWKEYRKRRVTEDELLTWFGLDRSQNFIIVCGALSNLVVIDADSQAAVDAMELQPDTYTVQTTKGRHYYYRHPGVEVGNRSKATIHGQALDVRGDLGVIAGPGSTHESGHVYAVVKDLPLLTFDPAWISERDKPCDKKDRAENVAVESSRPRSTAVPYEERLRRARLYAEATPEAVSGGHPVTGMPGGAQTFKLSIALVKGFQLSEQDAWEIMQEYNKRCVPEWSEKELEHKLEEAVRDTQHAWGYLIDEKVTADEKDAIDEAINYDDVWNAPPIKRLVPTFDMDWIPNLQIRDLVFQVSDMLSVDPGAVYTVLLGCLSASFAPSTRVKIVDGFEQPSQLYTMVVMKSGEGKSPIFKALTSYIHDFDKTQVDQAKGLNQQREAMRQIHKVKLQQLERKAKNCKPEDEMDLSAEIAFRMIEIDKLSVPESDGYVENDTTVEGFTRALQRQPSKVVIDEEGTFIRNVSGMYSKRPNLDLIKKTWSGEPIVYRRVSLGDEAFRIYNSCVTLITAIQPDAARVLGKMHNASYRGEGFIARFLICMPLYYIDDVEVISKVLTEHPIFERLKEGLEIRKMSTLELDPDAFLAWEATFKWCRRQAANQWPEMHDWLIKASDQVARIAALMTVFGRKTKIDQDTVIAAAKVVTEYFIFHAADFCGVLRESPGEEHKKSMIEPLITWLKSVDGDVVITLRYIQRHAKPRKYFGEADTEDIRTCMEILEERGMVVGVKEMKKGGKTVTKSWRIIRRKAS